MWRERFSKSAKLRCWSWTRCKGAGARKKISTANSRSIGELDLRSRPNKGLARKLRALLDPRVPYPHGIGVDDEGNRRISNHVKNFDLVWFFKLRTANMFDAWAWEHSVLDIDDLPSGVCQTMSQGCSRVQKRLSARMQMLTWRRRERLLDERFNVLVVCSDGDKHLLRTSAPVHVIPNGFERPTQAPVRATATPPRIGFIGLFDYFPNFEGICWFLKQCWSLIKQQVPEARLRLVGRGSDGPIRNWGSDIDGLGWIDDASGEIGSWSMMIVPVHIGGGTRVKIAEGFSRKCPIVSTRIGALGYDVGSGQELLLADTTEDFAAACIGLIKDPLSASNMAERAYRAFLEKWTWDAIAPKVWAAAEDCLRRASRQTAPS